MIILCGEPLGTIRHCNDNLISSQSLFQYHHKKTNIQFI